MKITVVYNEVKIKTYGKPEDLLADVDTVKTAEEIALALSSLGYETELFKVDEESVRSLTKSYPTDLFFNNAFGIGSTAKSEADLTGILEKTSKPFSGATSKNIVLTTDKIATKKILAAAMLPVPGNSKFPLIIKPAGEDCSLGISQASVVNNKMELKKQKKLLEKTYAEEVLIEEFIDGRELNVTILGNQVLPISEIIFGKSFKSKYKIVDFAAKWEEETDEFKETVGVCPAKLSEGLRRKIEEIALKAFMVTNCRDFARVDMRLDKNNQPYILEVNANPGIGPNDGVVLSAKAAGHSYLSFLQKIVSLALLR